MLKLPSILPRHSISLENIYLKECFFQRKLPLLQTGTLVEPNIEYKINAEAISESKIRAYYDFFTVPASENQEKSIIDYKIIFEAIFSIEGGVFQEESVQKFLHSSGVVLIWPYFRQTLIDFTMRLGLPPLILPLLDVNRLLEKLQERKD